MQTLDILRDAGTPFAILHGADVISQGRMTSDLDVAVDVSPQELLTDLLPELQRQNLHPVICWNYDVGGATTIFLTSDDAGEGVQLDLLSDREGIGLDGIVTPPIVAAAAWDIGRWPRAKPVHELLYLIRKRYRKRDTVGLAPLLEQARSMNPSEIDLEAFRIFRSQVARSVCRLIHGVPDGLPDVRRRLAPLRRLVRIGRRLSRPVGFWVELAGESGGEEEARAIAASFGRILPLAQCAPRPSGAFQQARWLTVHVMPVRWRPGLFVSWSQNHPSRMPIQPDLWVTSAASTTAMSQDIVRAMESRYFT